MRRLVVLAAFVALALPLFATEANPSAKQRQLAEQLLDAMNMDRMATSMIDSMYTEIEKQFVAEAQAKGNDADDIAEAKELFAAFREHTQKIEFDKLLRDAQIRLYAKYFSEQELADMLAFYASPTGRKTIEVLPQLMADGMKLGMDQIGPKMQEVMTAVMKEHEQKRPWRRTMSDMRALATAIEAYKTDQEDETVPAAADLASLKAELDGISMSQEFPEHDMWGHPYEYVVSPDHHHYRIVSAGADGIFEWDSRKIDAKDGTEGSSLRYRDRLEDDLIYADGAFVQLPVQAKGKQ